MAYGTIKVDTITFTDGGIDKSVAISGLVQNPTFTGNVTVTGTVSGNTIQGQTISGATVTGTTANFTSGNFTNISGGTHTITSGVFAAGTAANPSISFTSDPNIGIYSPGADQVAISTNGTGRLFVDGNGNVNIDDNSGNPSFYVDAVNNRVGIGVNLPLQALHISTASPPITQITYQGVGAAQVGVVAGGAFTVGLDGGNGSTERMRLDSSGRLGLGTSSPLETLTVSDGTATNGTMTLGNNASFHAKLGYTFSTGELRISQVGGGSLGTTFYTGGSERLRITNGGLVGIGSNVPRALLDIGGSAAFTGGTYQAPKLAVSNGYISVKSDPADGASRLTLIGDSATGDGVIDWGGNIASSLKFTNNGTERGRWDSSGRFLVGTSSTVDSSSTALLQVSAASGADFGIGNSTTVGAGAAKLGQIGFYGFQGSYALAASITANADATWSSNDYPTRLVFSTTADGAASPTERMRLDSSGRLGLGTSSPSELLTVAGNIRVNNTNAAISLHGANGSSPQINLGNAAGAIHYSIYETTDPSTGARGTLNVYDAVAAASRLVIDSSGRVGIGVTGPGSRLEVGGESGPRIGINSTGTGTTGVLFQGAGTTYGSIIENISSGELAIKAGASGQNSYFITFGTNDGSERARIDISGRLLVGTSTARETSTVTWKAQIEGANELTGLGITTNQNGGAGAYLSLAKSRGTTIGSNTIVAADDALGAILFSGADGTDANTQAATIICAVDGTPGANDMPGRLVFSTTADGASSPTERMRIDNLGRVGVNCTPASFARLHIQSDSDSYYPLVVDDVKTGTASATAVYFRRNAALVGTITTTNAATAYNTTSDYRLKENVVPLTGAIDRVNQLQVHRFNFIADPDKTVDGFIAHEAQAVVPECATGTKDEVDDDGNPVYQGIDQSKLVPLLTAALQEALAEIESLKARVTALEP